MTFAAVAAVVLALTAATGGDVSDSPPGNSIADHIEFGYFEDDTSEQIYDRMTEYAGTSYAEEFLKFRTAEGGSTSDIPILGELLETGNIAVEDLGGTVQPMFLSYPTRGSAIASGWAWQHSGRFNWTVCRPICRVTSYINYRLTTDPGQNGVNTQLSFRRSGSDLSSVTITQRAYRNSSGNGLSTITWNTPGTGNHNTAHTRPQRGYQFQGSFHLGFPNPNGTGHYQYKTAQSAVCVQPSGRAFRCVFP